MNTRLDKNVICHFRFICTQSWDSLTPMEGSTDKRFCDVCSSPVHLTSNYEELEANLSAKRCVAIFLENPQEQLREYIGFVAPTVPFRYTVESPDPIFTSAIGELELTPGILRKLQINNIQLVGDLVQCSSSTLTKGFGINKSQLNRLREELASRGLTTEMHLESWELVSAKYR